MSFSNQVIIPRHPYKPHIVKLQGLYRVSPYRWKKLWSIVSDGNWKKAHAYTNAQNDIIHAEQHAAKERQREWKRKQKEGC